MKAKKTFLILFVVIGYITTSSAQVAPVVPSSSTIANAGVAQSNGWGSFHNTASLGGVKNIEFGVQYENKFMVKELSTRSVQLGYNAKYVNVGVAYSYYGYAYYNEMLAGVALAREFSPKLSMGVQFNYYSAYFENIHKHKGVLLPQLGILSQITDKLTLGFNTFNPFQATIRTKYTEKRLPSVFSIGTNYAFSEDLRWLTQVDKEVTSDLRIASGFEYTMLDRLTVKLGASMMDYLVPAIGAGFHWKGFKFDLNTELHPILGLNTQAALKYKL